MWHYHSRIIARSYSWTKLPHNPDDAKGRVVEQGYMDLGEISSVSYTLTTADAYMK